MTDDRLDDLMASMAPISEAQVAELPLSGPETDLMEAIMSTTKTDSVEPAEPGGPDPAATAPYLSPAGAGRRGLGRRPRLALAVLAVAALVLVAALVWPSEGARDDVDVAAKPQVTEPADDGVWILLDRPGWTVTEVDTFGQTIFSDGSHRLTVGLTSYQPAPGEELEPDVGSVRNPEGGLPLWDQLPPRQVLGHEAVLLQSKEDQEAAALALADPAGTDAFLAQWNVDDGDDGVTTYLVTSELPTAEEFFQLLDGLRYVDADSFAAAVPDSYVGPEEQTALIDELLTDVPRPDGYDPAPLVVENRGVGQKRRELVDGVALSVVCGWVESWIAATDAGDGASAGQAVDALRAFLDSRVVDEMMASPSYFMVLDHYPTLVEEFADAMAEGRPVTLTAQGPGLVPIPGDPYPVRDVYESMLGCVRFRTAEDVEPPVEGQPGEIGDLSPD